MDTRLRIAEIIHEAWTAVPFDPQRDTEDLAAADALIAAFPALSEPVASVASE